MAYNRVGMLRFLRVRNFALIDQLELHFQNGFSLLSGETGAGKSLIVDSLGLLVGAKASTEMVRSGEARAIVEAIFDIDVNAELDEFGLDADNNEVIVRREISADGRNRVFINNQPSTVAVLKGLAPFLLDIHGQHEQQTLLDPFHQLTLIDRFADAVDLSHKVKTLDAALRLTQTELKVLMDEHARKVERLDLLRFQHDEIQKAAPSAGEIDHARERLQVLSHAGKLQNAAVRGHQLLYESDASAAAALAQAEKSLRDAAQHDKRLQPLLEQTQTARILVQEIAYGLRDYAADTETDPQQLERLQMRLAELEKLQRKYGPDLLAYLEKVRGEMDSIGLAESQKVELEKNIESIQKEYRSSAEALSAKRRAASQTLEARVQRELASLAMPNAQFKVVWQDVSGGPTGIDRADLSISANPGEEPRPIDKIASGGELSRIMLALRTVLSAEQACKTLVFDEVDAGIGGKAAETVGKKLQELSARYQVLCVTHLAQIAAFAHNHYCIEKLVLDGRTVTRVEALSGEARIEELVRMMSGSRVTEAARQHVKELLAGH
jgi:DNA repair protein RecN (Recombination protein N)